jgi:phosphatidylserine/phosphatidylglycerophosphate/cardiolipin synthase-like enzyme
MYNPIEDDNYFEWVELYNPTNTSVNVSGYSITDNYSNDLIEADFDHSNGTTIIPPYGYGLIVDHGTKIYENYSISNNTIKLYVHDSSIGNGLGNNQDKLILKNITGVEIDNIEWGYDYPDVSGMPATLVDKGHSLARYKNIDTNDTSNDFYEGIIPTPGTKNLFIQSQSINIDLYPLFIAKIQNNSMYSLPFAIKINISNYEPNKNYQIKSYVVGDILSRYPATQTWDTKSWIYSDRYTLNITTDDNGNWSGWTYLRFNKDYTEYQTNIKHNCSAYLNLKIKKEDNSTDEISKKVYLLDMDDSTSNATKGGYIAGKIENNNTFLENKIIFIENKTNIITGIYFTEDNKIDENFVLRPGYFKITSPVDTNYSIKVTEQNNSIIQNIKNISVKQGKYGVDIYCSKLFYLIRKNEDLDITLSIENTGDFSDIIDVSISQITDDWYAALEKDKISLNSKGKCNINLHVEPCQENGCKTGSITIHVNSEKDIGETSEITLKFEIFAPDLTINTIKNYNEKDEESNIFRQGETIKIKAFLKNIGNENATDVDVMFYYDYIDKEHYIGSKNYDSVSKYQKYPSIQWDTIDVAEGSHRIIVIVDEKEQISELDELNNELPIEITILGTQPFKKGETLLITQVYYHAHPNLNNEFITIYNPTNLSINISGFYLTNQPLKNRADQTKIVFPNNTIIQGNSFFYITQNASAYFWETGKKPDFEYSTDSLYDVLQMITTKKFTLGNNGGMVALKDWYNHTIDLVTYGEISYNTSFWKGPPIQDSGAGVILKRNFDKAGFFVDTNTSNDWLNPRKYGIGQSDFPYTNISFNGEIKTFVSPDNSFDAIVNELRKANESIYFNIYEFTNPFLSDELIGALRRNVSVNIFVEGSPVGGISDEEKYIINRIAAYGGNIRFIVNDLENDVYARYTFDHAKYLIIDNKTVIIESCNWAKTGIPVDPTYGNREWGIIIRNTTIAKYFLNVFLDDYNPLRCDSYSFEKTNLLVSSDYYMDKKVYKGYYEPLFESENFAGNFSAIPVFSPDTSYMAICNMINDAKKCIYVEQLYIYKNWDEEINPFVEHLVNKSKQGVDVKIILNYNPDYEDTNNKCNITKQYLQENGIAVKFIYTNWSYFTNVHNKGMIVDNKTVLISSINWNKNSVTANREAGIIIKNESIAKYYATVFLYDWSLNQSAKKQNNMTKSETLEIENNNRNIIYIIVIYAFTFLVVARDWRKRKWT